MPSTKRMPIDYKPQFSDDIFRPKDVVETELENLDTSISPPPLPETAAQQPDEVWKERSNDLKKEGSFERKKDLPQRTVVHHSFDVYEDQLLSLKKLALTRQIETGDKVTIGAVIREAIDAYFEGLSDDLKI
jgi:hypothetical protein